MATVTLTPEEQRIFDRGPHDADSLRNYCKVLDKVFGLPPTLQIEDDIARVNNEIREQREREIEAAQNAGWGSR